MANPDHITTKKTCLFLDFTLVFVPTYCHRSERRLFAPILPGLTIVAVLLGGLPKVQPAVLLRCDSA